MNNEKNQQKKESLTSLTNEDFSNKFWDESWVYIKTIADVVHESVLILDDKLCVITANEPFCKTFQVERSNTENKSIYSLGNGQWDIPALHNLLEKILPQNTFFNGFEVTHDFPVIGRKIMLLNARQITYHPNNRVKDFPPITVIAIEDITDIIGLAESLASNALNFQPPTVKDRSH